MELSHLVDFRPQFTRETTFVASCLFSCTLNPFCKRVYLKRREISWERKE